MVVGIKSEFGVEADSIPILCSKDEIKNMKRSDSIKKRNPTLMRALSRAEMNVETGDSGSDAVEFFFASDASAIIEHTNKVIFLGIKPTNFLTLLRKLFQLFQDLKLNLMVLCLL